jgi:hypothetical protein
MASGPGGVAAKLHGRTTHALRAAGFAAPWRLCEGFNGFKKTACEALDAEVDGGQEAVRHENEISAMGVGNGEVINRIKVGELAIGMKGLPAIAYKKIPDLVVMGGRCAGNGGLLDQKAETCGGRVNSEKTQLVGKKKIMPMPAFQVIDRGGAGVFIGPVHDLETKKARPCGFEKGAGGFSKPDLVFVALIGGGEG